MARSTSLEWWRPEPAATIPAAAAPGSAVPFWALMTFTFILLLAPQNFFPVLEPFRIALLAAAVGITVHLADRFLHGQPLMIFTREVWITTGIVGWAILTVPLSYWPGGSVSFLLDFYLKTLAIFWLLSNTVTTLGRLRQVAWGLSLMSVPLAVSAVNNYLSGEFLADGAVKRIAGYEAPLTGNPNDLALMLNLILPLGVALALGSRKPIARAVLLVILGLQVVAVILTFSRAGFVTLAGTSVMYLWKLRTRRQRVWAFAAVGLVLMCIPLLPSGYLDRLGTIVDSESDRTGSSQARWLDTVAAVSFVLGNPIVGAGIGTNVLALNEVRGPAWTAVHNVYLQLAVELGLPGLALFLLLLVGCLKRARLAHRGSTPRPASRELVHLAEGIQISLVAFALAALFHPVGYHFYFYYIAGLAVAVKAVCEAKDGNAALDQSHSSLRQEWPG